MIKMKFKDIWKQKLFPMQWYKWRKSTMKTDQWISVPKWKHYFFKEYLDKELK